MDLSIFDDLSIDITDLIGRYVSDYHRQRLNFCKVNSELIDNKGWVQLQMDRPLELHMRIGKNFPIHPARKILQSPIFELGQPGQKLPPMSHEMKNKIRQMYICNNNKFNVTHGGSAGLLDGMKKFKIDTLCENREIVINDLRYRTEHIEPGDFRSPNFTKDVDVVVAGNMTENKMIIIYKKKFGEKNFNRVKNTIECQPRKGLRGWPSDEQLKEKKLLVWKGLME